MKANKTMIIILSVLTVITLFTGCIDPSKSTYFDPWFDTEGYVVYTQSQRTNDKTFSEFVESNNIPDGEKFAVKWEHIKKEGTSKPWCTFKYYKRVTDAEAGYAYELVEQEDKTKSFRVTTDPYESLEGFIIYCDDENVYVINNLYKFGYKDVRNERDAEFKFVFDVYGMKYLTLYMALDNTSTKPY